MFGDFRLERRQPALNERLHCCLDSACKRRPVRSSPVLARIRAGSRSVGNPPREIPAGPHLVVPGVDNVGYVCRGGIRALSWLVPLDIVVSPAHLAAEMGVLDTLGGPFCHASRGWRGGATSREEVERLIAFRSTSERRQNTRSLNRSGRPETSSTHGPMRPRPPRADRPVRTSPAT